MVDNPMEDTTIIEMAAENPPKKTNTVNIFLSNN